MFDILVESFVYEASTRPTDEAHATDVRSNANRAGHIYGLQ